MLKTCQVFLSADIIRPPFVFLLSRPVDGKANTEFNPQNFVFNQSSLPGGVFFLPIFNTCKVDTYFQKNQNDAV